MLLIKIKIFFIIIFFPLLLFSQDNKFLEREKQITDKIHFINDSCAKFNINPHILATIIFTEKYLNSNWLDDELDFILVKLGINASCGFCQIKPKTAEWIEEQLNHEESKYYLGKDITNLIKPSKNNTELIDKLANDSINILYASAFLAMNIKRWKDNGIDISNNIEILGTLYTNGARKPNNNMSINSFGKRAKEFYMDKNLLKELK